VALSTWQAIRATRAEQHALAARRQESLLRQQAESERERAEQERASARLNEYVADINLAQQSLAAGNYGRAVQLLDKHRPPHGETDLRGFEWRYLWQVSQGDKHTVFPAQDGAVLAVACSPQGDLVAVGTRDHCNLYHARTRDRVASLPKGAVSITFSPDGRSLLTAGPAGREPMREGAFQGGPPGSSVSVWRTADWSESKSLPRQSGPLALSADGTRLATVRQGLPGRDGGREGVRLWDTAMWGELLILSNATAPMALAPDGRTMVAETRAGLTLWPLAAGSEARVLPEATNLFTRGGPGWRLDRALAFSPDGQFVVAARNTLSDRGVFLIGVWNARTGEAAAMPDDPEHIEHTGAIAALAFSPDGRFLATASLDYSIRLWDFLTRQRISTLQGHLSEVWALAFTPDGQALVSGAKDGTVKWWSLQRQEDEDLIPGPWQQMLAISKDGTKVAALDRQATLVFLDLATRERVAEFQLAGPSDRMRFRLPSSIALSDDFSTLVHAQDDGQVEIRNTETRESRPLKVSDRMLGLVALAPDGRTLVTGGFGQSLRCWDWRNGTNSALESEPYRVVFSPDGRTLATFQRGDMIELWDMATRTRRTNLVSDAELRLESTPAFSPNGSVLALICADDTVRLWNTATGRTLGTCTGHKQAVSSVAFAPDGKTLATASEDSTLKFWNVATQQELLTIRRLGGALRTLLFSPDGRVLIGRISSSLSTGGLRLYRTPRLSDLDAAEARVGREQ
jgi:WD40 repeat protein